MLRTNDAAKFWRWFEEKSDDFRFFREMEPEECEEIFEELTERLHLYCTSLFFEMRINTINEGELIITAEGNEEFFDDAEFLVSKAPEIDHWTFTALIPADEEHEGIEYEDLDLTPSEMWFTAIEDEDMPEKLNLVIHYRDYEFVKQSEHLDTAMFLLLQSVLGEKAFAQYINIYTMTELPGDPEEDGYPALETLPEYIASMANEGKKDLDDYR
ncbi:hypothetical protein [Chitinophaga filiformis]|uniref:DUF695 domain-containing protein n=1 Tax=Chitinophaga filiformis TaxID=104663 RepID=A0A1G7LT24_CHIFI|nr:hypothetical protein [Chitinophaga filiformis]SDF52504.1 hypothetical protein SAMN04488121_102173 [Chitinophaga filiformis]